VNQVVHEAKLLDHRGCDNEWVEVAFTHGATDAVDRALLKASVIRACVRYRTKACNACCVLMKRRMQIALERAQECERAAGNITDRKFRDQWLDLARQWRELAESMRRADHDGE